MIQNLCASSLSFKGNEISVRDAYADLIKKNENTIQRQNNMIVQAQGKLNAGVPMQGSGQKLDVIA